VSYSKGSHHLGPDSTTTVTSTLALTQLPQSLLPLHLPTLGHSQKMQVCNIRLSDWVSLEAMTDGDEEGCQVKDNCSQ